MMKRKTLDRKCKHEKKKSVTAKMSPVCFTVNLHNSNTNTICNRNIQKNKQIVKAKAPSPPPPHPMGPGEGCKPQHCHGCIPRGGELVINGGFENKPDPFLGWVINAGVGSIHTHMGDIPHQGFNAARLGTANTRGFIYQDVPGVCPGLFYQLDFFLSASSECGNESVIARMEFLDHNKNPLNAPVLDIFIPKNSLSNESYTFFINATRVPAPLDAKFARISFTANCDEQPDRAVHLDDVSLIAI